MIKNTILILTLILNTFALETKKEDVKIGIYENLGKIADINTTFTTQDNKTKTIKEFMKNKPTIISLNYYKCPGICSSQFAAVASLAERLKLSLDEFRLLTISIETQDTPELAKEKQKTFYDSMFLKPNYPNEQWQFLVGSQENITKFTNSVGYKYKKQINKDGVVDYLHPGALIILSPSGKITRYIYGTSYSAFDVELALNEAYEGKERATRVAALQLCFAYDAQSKKYVFQWEKVVGGLMFLMVVLFFIYLAITGRKK